MFIHLPLHSQKTLAAAPFLPSENSRMESVTTVPEKAEFDSVTTVPETAEFESVTTVPETAEFESLTTVPETAKFESLTTVPEMMEFEFVDIVPETPEFVDPTSDIVDPCLAEFGFKDPTLGLVGDSGKVEWTEKRRREYLEILGWFYPSVLKLLE